MYRYAQFVTVQHKKDIKNHWVDKLKLWVGVVYTWWVDYKFLNIK